VTCLWIIESVAVRGGADACSGGGGGGGGGGCETGPLPPTAGLPVMFFDLRTGTTSTVGAALVVSADAGGRRSVVAETARAAAVLSAAQVYATVPLASASLAYRCLSLRPGARLWWSAATADGGGGTSSGVAAAAAAAAAAGDPARDTPTPEATPILDDDDALRRAAQYRRTGTSFGASHFPAPAAGGDPPRPALVIRAFQNPGFAAESGIHPDISGYIRWNHLAIQCESKTEDTAGKITSCSVSS